MTLRKHKGTEFSNIKRIWDANEKDPGTPKEIDRQGNDFSNVSDTWDENEKGNTAPSRDDEFAKAKEGWESNEKERSERKEDYWDNIADDPAHGYKNDGRNDSLFREDQERGGDL